MSSLAFNRLQSRGRHARCAVGTIGIEFTRRPVKRTFENI
jgi:hypothetical protein